MKSVTKTINGNEFEIIHNDSDVYGWAFRTTHSLFKFDEYSSHQKELLIKGIITNIHNEIIKINRVGQSDPNPYWDFLADVCSFFPSAIKEIEG